jgi:hypothetical protein
MCLLAKYNAETQQELAIRAEHGDAARETRMRPD